MAVLERRTMFVELVPELDWLTEEESSPPPRDLAGVEPEPDPDDPRLRTVPLLPELLPRDRVVVPELDDPLEPLERTVEPDEPLDPRDRTVEEPELESEPLERTAASPDRDLGGVEDRSTPALDEGGAEVVLLVATPARVVRCTPLERVERTARV